MVIRWNEHTLFRNIYGLLQIIQSYYCEYNIPRPFGVPTPSTPSKPLLLRLPSMRCTRSVACRILGVRRVCDRCAQQISVFAPCVATACILLVGYEAEERVSHERREPDVSRWEAVELPGRKIEDARVEGECVYDVGTKLVGRVEALARAVRGSILLVNGESG